MAIDISEYTESLARACSSRDRALIHSELRKVLDNWEQSVVAAIIAKTLSGLPSFESALLVAAVGQVVDAEPTILLQTLNLAHGSGRSHIIRALKPHRDRKDIADILESMSQSADPIDRLEALKALGGSQEPEHLKAIEQGILSRNSLVREAAIEAALESSASNVYPLIRKLATDPEPDIRMQVAAAIGRFGSKKDIPLLLKMVRDRWLEVKLNALESLLVFDRDTALAHIEALAHDQDTVISWSAKNILERLRSPTQD